LDVLMCKIDAIAMGKEKKSFSRLPTGDAVKKLPKRSVRLIAMGSSTGGVQAARSIIPKLRKETPPIVWVQHMPPAFTTSLAKRLDGLSAMRVKEAEDGERVVSGTCYLAPGGTQMRVRKELVGFYIVLGGQEKVSGHCPSCDVLFDSVAEVCSSDSLGVILTGMGEDGAKGLKKMHDRGAFVIGQDEATSVVYGMPKAAYEIGSVDVQMGIEEISEGIQRVVISSL